MPKPRSFKNKQCTLAVYLYVQKTEPQCTKMFLHSQFLKVQTLSLDFDCLGVELSLSEDLFELFNVALRVCSLSKLPLILGILSEQMLS